MRRLRPIKTPLSILSPLRGLPTFLCLALQLTVTSSVSNGHTNFLPQRMEKHELNVKGKTDQTFRSC